MQTYIDRIQQGDGGAMAGLWDQVKGYAYKVAARYDGLADPDDLRQEAFLAALAAAEHFDKAKGVPFLPYMGKCISFNLQKYITNNGPDIPINTRAKLRKVARFKEEYYMACGEVPKDATICHELQITREELQDLYLAAYSLTAKSTAAEIAEDCTLEDVIADPEDKMEDSIKKTDQESMAAALWELVDSIDGGDILRMIYQEGMTLQEVADEKSVGTQTIHAKRNRLLRKIRQTPKAEPLKRYHEEYIAGLYKLGNLTYFRHTHTSEPEHIALERLSKQAEHYRFIYGTK